MTTVQMHLEFMLSESLTFLTSMLLPHFICMIIIWVESNLRIHQLVMYSCTPANVVLKPNMKNSSLDDVTHFTGSLWFMLPANPCSSS
jgi:hypothetical protein